MSANGHRELRMVACISLDGFISSSSGDASSWASAEAGREVRREVGESDVVIAGRRALEWMEPTGKPTVMVSRDPSRPVDGMAELDVKWVVDPYPSEVHDFLGGMGGKRFLVYGGSQTFDFFLRWNLVDHLTLLVEPALLGKGTKLRTPPQTMGGQDVCRFFVERHRPINSRGTMRVDLRRAKAW